MQYKPRPKSELKLFPRHLRIAGKDWTVTLDPDQWGGCFDNADHSIHVGQMGTQQWEVLLHEIGEIILTCGIRSRYENNGQEIRFCFDHEQYTQFSDQLFAVLSDNAILSTRCK